VASYARSHFGWTLYGHERALGDATPAWFRRWEGDGIIARVESKRLAEDIARRNIPTVDLRGLCKIPNVPVVETNDLAVIRLACDHLRGRGLRAIAFSGFAGVDYSERRKNFVIEYLASLGVTPLVNSSPHGRLSGTSDIEAEGLLHEEELYQFLSSISKPAGVIACNDIRGAQVLDACRAFGVKVPDDVAVIGVDNDELICEMTDPPLSSVLNDTHRIGYHACEILAAMIAGRSPPSERVLINPLGVVSRRSSDTFAFEDEEVGAALRFIRDHACEGISVADVANAVCMSRSALDRRFARVVGKSVKSEINRIRIERVKRLLVDTEYKLLNVAQMAGFPHLEYLSAKFKEHTGLTLGQFRSANKGQTFEVIQW
jgi:LacI family transcriptional regulator